MNKIKLKIQIENIVDLIQQNKLYIMVWLISLITVVHINTKTSTGYSFVGVTETKGVNINSKYPVILKDIHVIPGQEVKSGQLVAELERPDLTLKINEVESALEETIAQYRLNVSLNKQLKSVKLGRASRSKDLLIIQIEKLEKELKILQKEREQLFIFSKFDGYIGTIYYKINESVSPFTSIIDIHKGKPSLIRGYIHENISNKIQEGQVVRVSSFNDKEKIVLSKVESISNRIIEFPERFRRRADQRLWGREVVIKLPIRNDFLEGEKVFIEVNNEDKDLILNLGPAIAYAKDIPNRTEFGEYVELLTDENSHLKGLLEPSGIIFNNELNKYLMISDDNYEDKLKIYLLSEGLELDQNSIEVDGIKKIKDIESISQDEDGHIYVLSSMSENKNGHLPKTRRKLVKIKQDGIRFEAVKEIDLLKYLENISKDYPHLEWVRTVTSRSKDEKLAINAEGMFLSEGSLYIGLREPTLNSNTVMILRVEDIQSILNDDAKNYDPSKITLWKELVLPTRSKEDLHEGISDMMIYNHNVILTTASNKLHKRGRLLKFNTSDIMAQELYRFEDRRPEGVTYNPKHKSIVVVFDDNDGKSAQVVELDIQL